MPTVDAVLRQPLGVDAVLGALAQAIGDRIPAASHGSMNNVALGSHRSDTPWDYYETMGGGLGAGLGACAWWPAMAAAASASRREPSSFSRRLFCSANSSASS